jgi:predicted translin family RNA/ssDNA-binding protein
MSLIPAGIRDVMIERQKTLSQVRRELSVLSSEILSLSKRCIFAFHRNDSEGALKERAAAQKKLEEGRAILKKHPLLSEEGSWKAAREEFAEADFLAQYLADGKIKTFSDKTGDPDVFIGGLSDFVGELVRQAVLLATQGEGDRVEKMYQDAQEVIAFLLQMDLTGNLRTKTDQAKQHLRKLEEIRYDLSMRRSI